MYEPTWCPGCGNFGIFTALKNALMQLSIKPTDAVAIFDIGCNSNMVDWSPITPFESLHGRPLPVAQGVKMAKPELTVLAISGDGGCYGEGGNHLLHAAKRNMDITLLVHDNQVYALTTGQTSPTSEKSFKTKSTPMGSHDLPVNPIAIALAAGASFVARGFAGDIPHLTDMIVKAVNHQGFSIVDILQPCVSFNPINTFDWFKQRVYDLNKSGYQTDQKIKAMEKAFEWPFASAQGKPPDNERIPIGIFFQEEREIFQPRIIKTESNFDSLTKDFI